MSAQKTTETTMRSFRHLELSSTAEGSTCLKKATICGWPSEFGPSGGNDIGEVQVRMFFVDFNIVSKHNKHRKELMSWFYSRSNLFERFEVRLSRLRVQVLSRTLARFFLGRMISELCRDMLWDSSFNLFNDIHTITESSVTIANLHFQ